MLGTKSVALISAVAASVAPLFGCGFSLGEKPDKTPSTPQSPTLESYTGINDKILRMTSGLPENVRISNGYSNGGMFDCFWSNNNVLYNAEKESVELKLTTDNSRVYGAEMQTHASYGYGYFSVRMKAIKKEGVVSSFFTYIGMGGGQDEIDIEFLGKDTTLVQFNHFLNGRGGHEKLYDLGFDASEAFHEYGFKWEQGRITYFVDGKGVYTTTEEIPVRAGKIMINAWNGNASVKNWLGTFDKKFPVQSAEYKWVGYKKIQT